MVLKAVYLLFVGAIFFCFVFAVSPAPLSAGFIASSLAALIAAIMVRRIKKRNVSAAVPACVDTVRDIDLLRMIEEKIGILLGDINEKQADDSVAKERITEIQHLCFIFIEKKESIVNSCGTEAASEILSSFARGERYLNRAWSALVDGFPGEMAESLAKAKEGFSSAIHMRDQQ